MGLPRSRHLLVLTSLAALLRAPPPSLPSRLDPSQGNRQRILVLQARVSPDRHGVCLGDTRMVSLFGFDAGRRTRMLPSGTLTLLSHSANAKVTDYGVPVPAPAGFLAEWEYRAITKGEGQLSISVTAPGYEHAELDVHFRNMECKWKIATHFETWLRDAPGWNWHEKGDVDADVRVADPLTGELTGGAEDGGKFSYQVHLERSDPPTSWSCTPVDIVAPGDFRIAGTLNRGRLSISLESVRIGHKGYETTCNDDVSRKSLGRRTWPANAIVSEYFASGTTPLGILLSADERSGSAKDQPLLSALLTGLPVNGIQEYVVQRTLTSY